MGLGIIDELIKIKTADDLSNNDKLVALKALAKQIDEKLYASVKDNSDWREVYKEISTFFFGGSEWIEPPEIVALSKDEWLHYLNMVDPETGQPYNIPWLFPQDPNYEKKYVYFMWLKENYPEAFQRITNWK